jgi:hypothetical protein
MTRRVLQTRQLKMFMSPAEIHAEYQPLDADRKKVVHSFGHTRKEEDYELWGRKRAEADAAGLTPSVRSEGVQYPVRLATDAPGEQLKQQILGGHHRLAAAESHQLIPVLHDKDIWAAKSKETTKAYPYR